MGGRSVDPMARPKVLHDFVLRQKHRGPLPAMNMQPIDTIPSEPSFGDPPYARMLHDFALVELMLALAFVLIAAVLAFAFNLDFVLPSDRALAFTGMSYAVPLSLICLLGVALILMKKAVLLAYYVTAGLAYGIILVTHFNVKLWMSFVNPRSWDSFYWQTDQMVRPMVDASFAIHNVIDTNTAFGEHLYLFAFLAMFAGSIVVHSMQSFITFRKVIMSAMLVHILGALSYLVAPAVGPFLYEPGVNSLETARQGHMYAGYLAMMGEGRAWLPRQGSQFMFAAVAAMPSLHVASSAVFVYFAWNHARWLGLLYLPLFIFIMFEAVATRWHYWIDVVAGLALTALAIAITAAVVRPIERYGARAPIGARFRSPL